MPGAIRKLRVALAVAAVLAVVLVTVLFGLNKWWSHGEREDSAVWAQVRQETVWLMAILKPDPEGPIPPCTNSTKLGIEGGDLSSDSLAKGKEIIREAQNRLIREGWSLRRRERLDNGDGLGPRQFDRFERTIKGRTITVTFVGGEQAHRPGADRPALEPPGVMIIMSPKFCGF